MEEKLLRDIVCAAGVSGFEREIADIMFRQLKRCCDETSIDSFGNVIARKGKGKKKIMLCADMDEVGLLVKYITAQGFIHFIKVGGIDDRIIVGQRVVIKAKQKDVPGVIGLKPPHLVKEEERKQPVKYEDMFIDIGCKSREEAAKLVEIADPVIFEPNFGNLNEKFYYAKAVDNRVGCFALIKIMEKLKINAQVYAVATTQEEVGLKGARTSSFSINPDFALVIDTASAGDTPNIKEKESALRLGEGVAITIVEASGRGVIVNEKIKDFLISTARQNKIKYQIDVVEGGMTDGATIYMNREGILTGVLAIPARYAHSPTGVFHIDDLEAAIELAVCVIRKKAM